MKCRECPIYNGRDRECLADEERPVIEPDVDRDCPDYENYNRLPDTFKLAIQTLMRLAR